MVEPDQTGPTQELRYSDANEIILRDEPELLLRKINAVTITISLRGDTGQLSDKVPTVANARLCC